MDIRILAEKAGLTEISVRTAAKILKPRGGEFEIRARLRDGCDFGFAEMQPNGKWKYVIYKELLPERGTT